MYTKSPRETSTNQTQETYFSLKVSPPLKLVSSAVFLSPTPLLSSIHSFKCVTPSLQHSGPQLISLAFAMHWITLSFSSTWYKTTLVWLVLPSVYYSPITCLIHSVCYGLGCVILKPPSCFNWICNWVKKPVPSIVCNPISSEWVLPFPTTSPVFGIICFFDHSQFYPG